MNQFAIETKQLIDRATAIHAQEKLLSMESVLLVGKMEAKRIAPFFGISTEQLAVRIGLTPSQYWKRAAAARVIQRFPAALEMLRADKTSLSHLALISAKITDANSELIFKTISGKTRRDVEGFVSRVTPDGRLLTQEPEVDLRLRFKLKDLELLDRAREVLAHGGKTPSMEEALLQALEVLLDKKDPMRRAKRAVARTTERPAPGQEEGQSRDSLQGPVDRAAPGQDGGQGKIGRQEGRRPAIRASVRHQVWIRDGAQCTWKFADGSRCRAKSMLELDHGVLWSRGGGDGVDNLSLKCRFHNQFSAEVQLGAEFMRNKRARLPADF